MITEKYLGTFNRTDQEDPLKTFRYTVEIESFARFGFAKCSKLAAKTDVVEYRVGGSNTTVLKSPGLTKFDNITLERGQVLAAGEGSDDCLLWYNQVFDAATKTPASSAAFRRTIDIVQFSKSGDEARRWRVKEAWPTGHSPVSDFDALTSANSIEVLEIVHEGYTLVSSAGR